MNQKFRVNGYELQAQRHIYPLYMADGRGGYEFSSTLTFVRFRNEHFCVFAAHALPRSMDKLHQIGVLSTDGEFMALSTVEISHKICRDRDLCVCHTIGPFEHKNYFDLDVVESSTEFFENFEWIGFPMKKAVQRIHSTKASSEKIRGYLTDGVEGLQKWTIAEFLLLGIEQKSVSQTEVTGLHINQNVDYTHEGFKQQGYSLKGMSGGALFRRPKKVITDSPRLSDIFQFVGIGLEYKNGQLVKGASKSAVQKLLEELLDTTCSSRGLTGFVDRQIS